MNGTPETKPAIKTSEFWLTMAVNLANLLAGVTGTLPARWSLYAGVITNGLYALARGWAKSGVKPGP